MITNETYNKFILPHDDYQYMASYQMTKIAYDATVCFSNKLTYH
jgi:hypothetical protein